MSAAWAEPNVASVAGLGDTNTTVNNSSSDPTAVIPFSPTTYTVSTLADAPHALPIDTTCTSTLAGGACTLRAAIQAANYHGGSNTINLLIQPF